jgi:serine/threonine-protein kinase
MANPEDLGRYRLKRLLGRGALGEVWEANDREQEGTKVAVKIMHAADDELALARLHFAREARLASLLRHPHVVIVQDAGEAAGTSFMVMDMVEGTSLRKLIGDPAVPLSERLRWVRQVGDGLAAMHRAGVVHRDLKPENVIVRPDGTACIVDLGIAKWTKFDLGGERDPMDIVEVPDASPQNTEYVPPETTDERLYDQLGDQYAWGVVAYELLTGVVPKEGSAPLTVRDDIPAAAAAAIERARSKKREDRWSGMELVLDELVQRSTSALPKRFSAPPGEPVEPSASAARNAPGGADETGAEPESRKNSSLVLAGAAALALLVLVGIIVAGLR